jgi:hypothetical protein
MSIIVGVMMRLYELFQEMDNDQISLKYVNISRDAKNNTISVVGMTTSGKRIIIKVWHESEQERAYSLLNDIKEGKNKKYVVLAQENKKPLSTQGAYNKADDKKYCRYDPPGTNNSKVSARRGMVG